MKRKVVKRLDELRQDFACVVGQPFSHFFCPILFVDESAELCEAHIVNKAFDGVSRRWTLQRKDVDSFFGTVFEASFVDLQFNKPGMVYETLIQPNMHSRFRPKIIINGSEVEHFVAKGPIPKEFAELHFELDQRTVRLGLKMPKKNLALKSDFDLQFEVSRDLRVPAVISALKAAHLTMFELLGYSYALSTGGEWLGRLLGTFYMENVGREKKDVLHNAESYFRPFSSMVRPVLAAPSAITGTIDDKWVHLCWLDGTSNHSLWGFVIYVRTAGMIHAILLPVLDHEAGAKRFAQFIGSQGDSFEVSIARLTDTRWEVQKERKRVQWPQAKFD
jgi:hypothetical protein